MKKYNRKIDVIIPAYNVPDSILFRCLASIACQDIVNELEVTIVDDASTEFEITDSGEYYIWSLTRDWTSVWDVKDPAGKYTIKIQPASI